MMRSDQEIRRDIEEQLDRDPQIGTRDIAVSVRNGVVTLAGFVRNYGEKEQAEEDTRGIADVFAIANDIEVRLPLLGRKPDPQIAREVLAAIQNEVPTASEVIRVYVSCGRVRLEGEVEWRYERGRPEAAARRVRGVHSITNCIVVKPTSVPAEVRHNIRTAFERCAEIDADAITVDVGDNGTVILSGLVSSPAERDEAERVAWSMAGVRKVDNGIDVRTDLANRIDVYPLNRG